MEKIPFDIKYRPEIESGRYKVVTRDGRNVRIICWDRVCDDYPIVALIITDPEEEHEDTVVYTKEGTFSIYPNKSNWDEDLFILTDEPELTEFEKGYIHIVHKMKPEDFNDEGLKTAKEEAAELLALARKEIMDGWSKGLRDTQDFSGKAYNDGYSIGFEIGYDKGKAEALKDLPRWEKIGGGNNYSSEVKFAINGRYLEMNDTLNDVYELKLLDLEKLPKED